MLDRLKKKLDKPYQLKASVKRGINQFLEMELETQNWKLNEEKYWNQNVTMDIML